LSPHTTHSICCCLFSGVDEPFVVVDPLVIGIGPFVVGCCVWGAGGPDWLAATTAEDSIIADGTAGTD
jgi:hypothetical protein